MEPTVGRVVHYKSAGSACGTYPSVVRGSIVTEVQDTDTVSLTVLNPTGMHFVQNVKRGDRPLQWDWMPYQKGQAQKTEELESQLTALQEPLKIGARLRISTVTAWRTSARSRISSDRT